MSIFNFKTFIHKVLQLRRDGVDIMFNCGRLVDPKQFDLRILPDDCDKYFEETNDLMRNFGDLIKSVEKETWKMVYDFWKARKTSMTDEDRNWRKDQFKKFIDEYDKRRNKNFKENFTELHTWI